ncbi:MAG: AraC family transcriptional regulator [Verrucomicrobiota bacterium]
MKSDSDPLGFQEAFFEQNPNARSVMGLFEFLPEVHFYSKDTKSRFVKVNQAFLERHGVTREEEVLGKSDRDFHPPAMAEAYIAEDQRVMKGGVPIPNQVWLVMLRRGTPAWFVSSKTPMFGPGGEVIGIAGAMYPIARPQDQEVYFRELAPVMRYIEAHFTEQISMEEMAKLAGLSSTHFNRRFRGLLRMAPTDFLKSLRVQEAQRLLAYTQDSMGEVALASGFYDQSHFTKRFKQVTGLTPLAYRKKFRVTSG